MALSKARKKLKKRTIQVIKQREYNLLERQVKKQVQEVNQRLKSLERQTKVGSWSSGKLKTRIKSNKTKGLMYKGKRIKLKPKMTKTNLTQVQKATRQFLESATSTKQGIKKVKEETVRTLQKTLNLEKEDKISEDDAEFMYNMLKNKEFAHFNKSSNKEEFIGASAIWSEIDRAYIENITEEDFVERLQNLRQQDFTIDEKKKAERIYQMYVAR